jgi:serine/threonine protein kinase/CheY-like chemotaxis protein
MSIRVLIIDDEEVYRRLLSQHVQVGFDSPVTADYDPGRQGRLPPEFHASGYDAVLLDESPGVAAGLDWLRDLTHRSEFPPVIYMMSDLTPESERAAKSAGAFACLSRSKIDNPALVRTLRSAQASRRRRGEPVLSLDELDRICRFGDLTIRGYKFVRKLAENPVSSVYLAQRLKTAEEVVLKVLRQAPDTGTKGADTFDRFLREYQIAAGIRHSNVVRIFDFGADDDHAYIAMEYFSKGDLRDRIKEGIKPLDALKLLRQMAEALKVLHDAGVLHRDLKPGNVMLRDDGSVVLIDFGMSKQLELDASITASGQIFGTPYYMSPEQGHGRETDERSDIYSLGVILYEMLMRRKPYVAGTPMQIIYKHANAPLPHLPIALKRFEQLLLNCMAKEPARRYPSAEAVVDAIKELERDEAEREAMAF